MASPCCKRAVSIWLKFCRGIPFSATATVVGRKTYHFSFTCGRGQFLQIWKGNLLFFCFVFHHQPVIEVKIGFACGVHFKLLSVHQSSVHPPVCLPTGFQMWERYFYLVPKSPLENALHAGKAEHQPEEVVDCHGVLRVGQLWRTRERCWVADSRLSLILFIWQRIKRQTNRRGFL